MQCLPDGLIFVRSQDEVRRNGDVNYVFRQDSYFLYLTGISQPGYALVLDTRGKKSHLFIPDKNEHHLIWIGAQLSKDQAKKQFGVAHAHSFSELFKVLTRLKKKYRKLYVLPSSRGEAVIKKLKIKKDVKKLKQTLDRLRLFKSPQEVQFIQTANRITHRAHIAAMKAVRPGGHEYEAQAALQQECLKAGAFHMAYPPIIGAGRNAAVLHYSFNNGPCDSGDLVLIDAGCEWHSYASDVTRVFPVNGRFTKKQKDIYNIVLQAQKTCIRAAKPGATMLSIHELSAKTIIQGLKELGIFKNVAVETLYNRGIHQVFYPHGVGHLLGLDVHDVGQTTIKRKMSGAQNLRTYLALKPGMVITVEPGIYFIAAYFDSRQKRKNLSRYINWERADAYRPVGGIRIEDDILITPHGHKNLTTVPKEIVQIESIMKQ